MCASKKLQIILITYNRAKHVEKTLEQFFAENSPVKDCDFLVLSNNSTDNTKNIVEKWQEKFPNIKYQENKYNVGLSGNIVKAMESANKDYLWLIGDDDLYDFSNWQEVENAINNNEELICVARYALPDEVKNDIASQLFQLTFITGGIYKTSLFDNTTIKNAYDNIYTLFPHMATIVQFINKGGHVYVVDKAISDNGADFEHTDCSYTREAKNLDDVYIRTKSMCWIVGYSNILSLLKDRKLREQAIDRAIVNKDLYGSFKNFYKCMQMYYPNDLFMQFIDVYINISDKHKKRLKKDYLRNLNRETCDIAQFYSFIELVILLVKKFFKQIYNLEKTQNRRYLTLMGFRITTKRRNK